MEDASMSRAMRFTDPGEGIHEAEIVEILVEAGGMVQEGDGVIAVETDKATTELPSPYSGRIADIAVAIGDQVRVGDVLLTFDGDGNGDADDDDGDSREAPPDESPPDEAERKGAPVAQSADVDAEAASRGGAPASAEDPDAREGRESTEAAPRQAAERELEVALERIEASGSGGRVLAEDVRGAGRRYRDARRTAIRLRRSGGRPNTPRRNRPRRAPQAVGCPTTSRRTSPAGGRWKRCRCARYAEPPRGRWPAPGPRSPTLCTMTTPTSRHWSASAVLMPTRWRRTAASSR
jgi:pyruvate dehydrogenase E2 component (dihydrolipoamide acetyltransferase)